jgi:hypothetical protein
MVSASASLSSPYDLPFQAISDLKIPAVLSCALSTLHYCHYLGRELFRLEFRSQAPAQYLAGVFLNAQCGQQAFVQAAAKVVLIAKECLGVIEEGGRLTRCVEGLWDSLKLPSRVALQYSAQRFALWNPEADSDAKPWFSQFWWPFAVVIARITLVARRIFDLLATCWHLHFYMWGLSEALSTDPRIQSEAIDDLLVNLGEVADQVGGQDRRLAKAVAQYRPWIDRALQLMGIQWSAQAIVDTLEDFASRADHVSGALSLPLQGAETACEGAVSVVGALVSRSSK